MMPPVGPAVGPAARTPSAALAAVPSAPAADPLHPNNFTLAAASAAGRTGMRDGR